MFLSGNRPKSSSDPFFLKPKPFNVKMVEQEVKRFPMYFIASISFSFYCLLACFLNLRKCVFSTSEQSVTGSIFTLNKNHVTLRDTF